MRDSQMKRSMAFPWLVGPNQPERVLCLLALLMVIFTPLWVSGQGILNSHHDFPTEWKGTGRNCMPCHFPKDTLVRTELKHFWGKHTDGLVFQVFSISNQDRNPGGNSKLCLSCHDGSIARNNHLSKPKSGKNVGLNTLGDGSQEHPISIVYNTSVGNTLKLRNPITTMSGLGESIEKDLLSGGRVEYTSCHDVHLPRNTQGCVGCHRDGNYKSGVIVDLSLRISNTNSNLCLTCHLK
jgi:hypothetical protein